MEYQTGEYSKGYKAGYKAATKKWVSVHEDLPINFKAVLVKADFIGKSYMAEICTIGTYQKDHWSTDRDGDIDKEEIHVTEWMEIPQ